MPTVPIAQNTVGIAEVTGAKLQAADFGAAGEAIGNSVARFGQQGQQFAEQQDSLSRIHDDASVKDAANGVNDWHAQAGYTGDNAYFKTGGKDALLARPDFEKGLDAQIKERRALLKTPRQQQMFDNAVKPQRASWGIQIAQHSDKETTTYDIGETAARASLSAQTAAEVAATDPAHSEEQLATGVGSIAQLGTLNHWGPERTSAEKLKYTSGARQDIAERFIYQGGANGSTVALAYLEKHRNDFTSDAAASVEAHARTYSNTLAAEQRRAEADARRQQSEDRREARQRVESVILDVGDGNKVDPRIIAGAVADAGTLDDPAMKDRLHKVVLKSNLTTEYQNATPAELQTHINTVSAKISRGDQTGDLTLERDHLTTLLNNSAGQLRSDPLSWAASHRGIDPGKLTLTDQGSIATRIATAQKVSRLTGAPLRVMTNEEAASYSATVSSGSVQQRAQLALSLAHFGPLATNAAQQIAPGNASFENLVGLGSHSNPAVAASRVNQILTGQEVLKSNAKLIDHGQAEQQFNGFVGNALQFLPSVRVGVLANSKSILADDANHSGAHDWGAASPRYFAAVNSALGGYHQGNVQYGGLSSFNGAPTVLPTDMSQQDFETRISRATGQMFATASGRTPFFANGKVPTATTLKQMQWVPVGDGRYRVTDGSGFVMTRDHQFYTIDVRKLK